MVDDDSTPNTMTSTTITCSPAREYSTGAACQVTVDGKQKFFAANTTLDETSMTAEIFIEPGPNPSMGISCKKEHKDQYKCVVLEGHTTVQFPLGSTRVDSDLQGGGSATTMTMPSSNGTAIVLKFLPNQHDGW